jgi:hypothetical protein
MGPGAVHQHFAGVRRFHGSASSMRGVASRVARAANVPAESVYTAVRPAYPARALRPISARKNVQPRDAPLAVYFAPENTMIAGLSPFLILDEVLRRFGDLLAGNGKGALTEAQ